MDITSSRSSSLRGQAVPLLPDPRVHEQEARGHIHGPQLRILRGCADPALRHEPVARFDLEPQAVLLEHAVQGRVLRAAGKQVCDGPDTGPTPAAIHLGPLKKEEQKGCMAIMQIIARHIEGSNYR